MEKEQIESLVTEFCKETHGRTDFGKDLVYVQGRNPKDYVPFKYLAKKIEGLTDPNQLLASGHTFSSHGHHEKAIFRQWYEHQFQKKLSIKQSKSISVIHFPDHISIFNSLEAIHKNYEILRQANVLINGKNMPVQVGEWYAKGIFGLRQVKSTSQKGFDFELDGKKIEVKVHWSDTPSPKGIKVKRSSIEMSDQCILMYLASNFNIKDICFLDCDFIKRKFVGKGHHVFLKDADLSNYFFSKSEKHFDKVVNKNALMKFSSPQLAMKLDGRI